MRLSKDEWEEMYFSLKEIERYYPNIPFSVLRFIRIEVDRIKEQIESVIGKLE